MSLIRASGAAATANPTTSWTATLSALIQTGDFVVALVVSRNHTSADAYPSISDDGGGSAWSLIGETATNRKVTLWGKVAVAGTAGATLTVSGCINSASGGYVAFISDGTNRITNFAVFVNVSGVESVTGFTPDNANSEIVLIVACTGNDHAISSQSTTNPGALTELWEKLSTGGSDCSSAVASAQQSGGPTATGDFTYSIPDDTSSGFIFAFSPVAGGVTVSPGKGALTLTGYAPTVTTPVTVSPSKGALVLTGYAPTVSLPVTVSPGKGALVITGYAPTVTTPVTVSPGKGALVLTGYAPVVSSAVTVSPGKGALVLTGYAPTVATPVTVSPGLGSLIVTGYAPIVSVPTIVSPGKGALVLTGYAPTVTTPAGVTVSPGLGSLIIRGYAPRVFSPSVVKAWAFVLDGHIFYVLDDVDGNTVVCDMRTGQWHHWYTGDSPGLWNMHRGIMWEGRAIAADAQLPKIWEVDPHSMLDEESIEISRVVTAFQALRGRASARVGSFRLTADVGEPTTVDAEVHLRFSDDEGQTWSSVHVRVLEIGNTDQPLRFRSLGRLRAPGRIWEISDKGGFVLIEGADADVEGENDTAES